MSASESDEARGPEAILVALGYVPDVGDLFTVVHEIPYRVQWWRALPWKRGRIWRDEQHYRVDSWLRRRPPRPAPRTEQERITREVMNELLAEGKIDPPRGFGPDNVPLEFCHRSQAEYVGGAGVGGTIERVSDVRVTGRVKWSEETIQDSRRHAELIAGEPLF